MSVMLFDLETVPDYAAIARTRGLSPDDQPAIKEAIGTAFPKHGFHRIVAIGYLVARHHDGVWTVVEHGVDHAGEIDEATMIARLMARIETHGQILVTYNGSSFDLPVLRYRAMVHGVSGRQLVLGRYFYRYSKPHIDLCDLLAAFDARAKMKLGEMCAMLGVPGKTESMDGSQVAGLVEAGRIAEVAAYCKDDVLATYNVFLAYRKFCGDAGPSTRTLDNSEVGAIDNQFDTNL